MNNSFFDFIIFPSLEPQKVIKQATGGSKKELLIVYQLTDTTDADLELLRNILKAIQYDLTEDALLYACTPQTRFNLSELTATTTIKTVLSFGVSPKQLGLNHTVIPYQSTQIQDCTLLFGHNLQTIAQNKSHKAALWGQLKALFT